MAIYHLHCDIIGRSGGRSATAAAAYRATEKIEDRTTGETFDFRKKERALYTEILTNGDVPEWATDRAELWNSCEEKENRKNSQFCRSFDGALPKEFDLETNIRLSKQFAEIFTKRGTPADLAVHAPHKDKNGKSNDNTHFHLLVATRKMNKDGWTEKDREANDKDFLKQVRKSWAEIVNAEFERRGMSERIDERTLEEQGIDREPQQHQGVTATAMERKGKNPDRKKNKPQEPINQTIDITDQEINQDKEILRLLEVRKKAILEQTSPENQAQTKFQRLAERIQERGGGRKTTNDIIDTMNRENLYHYVRQHSQEEILHWSKNRRPGESAYNEYLDEKISEVKKISGHDKFNREIYPTVDSYYQSVSSPIQDRTHWSKIKSWIQTTDFLPVKITRLTIEKLRAWRDDFYPKFGRSKEQKNKISPSDARGDL